MSSITTYKFKKSIAEGFLSDIRSRRSRYYQFFGAPLSTDLSNTIDYEVTARRGILSAKRIYASDICYVVPRFDWVSGDSYAKYNSLLTGFVDASGPKFYVYESVNHRVYKCINNNNNGASTVMPTGTDAYEFTTADGYTWKYLYTIPRILRSKFLTGDYMPVYNALHTRFFRDGGIEEITIIKTGSGYNQATTKIIIEGDGEGAELYPVIRNGKLVDVNILKTGTGYSRAFANITDDTGTGAEITLDLNYGDVDSDQAIVELLAKSGPVDSIDVLSQGDGYFSATAKIEGDGEGATAQVEITNNKITRILVTNKGKGYTKANVVITGQNDPAPTAFATARVNVGPYLGHGRNAVDDLFATKLALFSNIYSDRLSDFDVDINYAQYGLARDFMNHDFSTSVYDQVTSSRFVVSSEFGPYVTFEGGSGNGARGIVSVTGQFVDSVLIESAGSGYTSTPTVQFTGITPTVMPTAHAVMVGELYEENCTIDYPGIGYRYAPYIKTNSTSGRNGEIVVSTGSCLGAVLIMDGGSSYTSAPTISIVGGGGTGATATAYISSGKIVKIEITDPGQNYTSAPTITAVGGGGNSSVLSAVMSTGLNSIIVASAGQNYTEPPTLEAVGGCGISSIEVIDPGEDFNPSAICSVVGGNGAIITPVIEQCIRKVNILARGSGYVNPSAVISGGGGSGASISLIVNNGQIKEAVITSRGYGYTSAPTISITDTTGVGASISATVSYGISMVHISNPGSGIINTPNLSWTIGRNFVYKVNLAKATVSAGIIGYIKSVNIDNPGSGVTETPTVTLVGGGLIPTGTAASVYGKVLGSVTGVTITHAGTGYTSPPNMIISSIEGTGATAIVEINEDTNQLDPLTVQVTSGGSGYPIHSFGDFELGSIIVDDSKHEFSVLAAKTNLDKDMLILQSNSGFPIYANTYLRKKNTSFRFRSETANANELVESRFPVACYRAEVIFDSNAAESDFDYGSTLRYSDAVNGDKDFILISKKLLDDGSGTYIFMLSAVNGGKINTNMGLSHSISLKSLVVSAVADPDIDVNTGDILLISNSNGTFVQNEDQSVSIRTIIQF